MDTGTGAAEHPHGKHQDRALPVPPPETPLGACPCRGSATAGAVPCVPSGGVLYVCDGRWESRRSQ